MNTSIYHDIATRTGGNIYIGVVGPVRTGKSTFIKRFMDTLVIPKIEDVYMKERAKDELPQSGSGKTIMTAEPKFVPEEAVQLTMEDGASISVRLVDCVGYMIDGAMGHMEGETERMVTTPWFDKEVTMKEAAETGTCKVITEHSTIGILVTTDGTVTDFGREDYVETEERVVRELQKIGKPFVVLLNSMEPDSEATQTLRGEIAEKYGVTCVAANCMTLSDREIRDIIGSVLYEFPVAEFGVYLPSWVDALENEDTIKKELYEKIRLSAANVSCIKDVEGCLSSIKETDGITQVQLRSLDLGTGNVYADIDIPREIFYSRLGEMSGFDISDDGDLIVLLKELSSVKNEYDKISEALRDVRETGYGVVMPSADELTLQEPEIVRRGGKYSVRLKATAPSIHMMMANVETEVSPAVGGERASGDIINFLLQEFEGDTSKIWESNIFGKSLHDIAGESLQTKIKNMPPDARRKLRDTLQRMINEGSGGLICIIL